MAKKILVIDDDRVNVNLIQKKLADKGYEVVTAYDGEEGLEKLKEECPNLIILDIEMPNKNGYTFMLDMQKKEEYKTIPVFILTTHSDMKPIFELKGAKEYMVKPVRMDDLLHEIQEHIG